MAGLQFTGNATGGDFAVGSFNSAANRAARLRLFAAILLISALSALGAGWSAPVSAARAGAVSTNQWECSSGDVSSRCALSDLAPMPVAESAPVSVTAPCPGSRDTCLYDLGSGRSVQAYDVSTNVWISSDAGGPCVNATALQCMPVLVRSFAAAVDACPGSADTCIYIVGGSDTTGAARSTVQAYDTASNQWMSSDQAGVCAPSNAPSCMPTARAMLAAVTAKCPQSDDRCVYALGGIGVNGTVSRAVEAYDPSRNAWTSSETGGPCGNGGALACMPAGRAAFASAAAPCPESRDWCAYAVGGATSAAAAPERTVQAYDPVTNAWVTSDEGGSCANTAVSCLLSGVTQASGTAALCPAASGETCVYVVGGANGTAPAATNQAYDPATNRWISSDRGGTCANDAVIACMPTSRSSPGVATAACPGTSAVCVYATGGTNGSGALTTVEAYDAQPVTGTSIYVSPSGNDANPGTYFFPLGDLPAAQQAVRAVNGYMTADVTVYLENGTYRLTKPLQLGGTDSGTNGHYVRWEAAGGEIPIVSGGERITGWRLSDPAKNLWIAPVPAGLRTRQVYVNGMRASLTAGALPVKLTKTSGGYIASSSLMAHWRNPTELEFEYTGGLGLMAEPICPIASIHGAVIKMAEPCWTNTSKRALDWVSFGSVGTPTAILNAYAFLTHPGEFYLDQQAHEMYYIPRTGQDMTTADVEAATLQTLLQGDGTPAAPIHNLEFSGIQFSYATWLQPGTAEGFSEIQSGYTITGPHGYDREGLCHYAPRGTCPYGAWTKEPGNVQFSYDRDITFLDDGFLHLGAAGLNLDEATRNVTVQGCVFTDISGNGLEIGNADRPRAAAGEQTVGVQVTDNHIYGLPAEFHGGVGILAGYVARTTIAHNQIDHTPYMAISIGWGGWIDKLHRQAPSSYSHDNVISDNLIYDIMLVMLDGGGIYTQGATGNSLKTGARVTGNVVHDMLQWGAALHSDNGASFITYADNVLYSNGAYDWNSVHPDYGSRSYKYDPTVIEDNYWQQGWDGPTSHGIKETRNHIITGPSSAPSVLLDQVGVEPGFRSVLDWRPADPAVPNAPERVVVWGGYHDAYISWRPSYAEGTSAVTSYTVLSSRGQHMSIPAGQFSRLGYAAMPGLKDNKDYSFTVSATNAAGTSTPSLPTRVVRPHPDRQRRALVPKVVVHAGLRAISLYWYSPRTGDVPVLAYLVKASDGDQRVTTGISQFLMTNFDCRSVSVLGNLTAGRTYNFSVQAITPNGTGPARFSPAIKAGA